MAVTSRVQPRFTHSFRLLLAVSALIAGGTAALASAPSAHATNRNYSCGSCSDINGPEDYISYASSTNYSANEVVQNFWRYNGGNSYTLLGQTGSTSSYSASYCNYGQIYGHGETTTFYPGGYTLAGHEDNYTC